MTAKQTTSWQDKRAGAMILSIAGLALAYIVGSQAFDTGSWWEYLSSLILLIYGFNRLITAIKND